MSESIKRASLKKLEAGTAFKLRQSSRLPLKLILLGGMQLPGTRPSWVKSGAEADAPTGLRNKRSPRGASFIVG